MKTPPAQLDHLHVFGLESGSIQTEKGGGSRYPLLGFTTQRPQKLLEARVSGGVEVGGIGDNTRVFLSGVHCVNRAHSICCSGGGGGRGGEWCSP